MRTVELYVRLSASALICILRTDACTRPDPRTASGSCINFDNIQKLFERDDPAAFYNEACLFRGPDPPTLEDLAVISNDVFNGRVPHYIQDNSYLVLDKFVGNSSTLDGSFHSKRGVTYGIFKTDVDTGTYSSIDFQTQNGKESDRASATGTAFFTYVRYTIGKKSIIFQSTTLGILLKNMTNGQLTPYGNYTGVSQGTANSFSDLTTRATVSSYGILNTADFASKNILHGQGRYDPRYSGNVKLDIYSVTGGTNATVSIKISNRPGMHNYQMSISASLQNPDKRDSFLALHEGSFIRDLSDSFGESNLARIFSMARSGEDIYLP
ncbi:uncharacterized protein LOC135197623 [Macrobrachium nipponense]|uniref:uncharacterized protein LOC135197623 n=1 Tax=Macrobrachium nipponense TaxID=159736 RepID=UPI0030C81601